MPLPRRDVEVARIHSQLIRAFRRAGVSGRLEHDPTDELNTRLITESGAVYGFANVTLACLETPRLRRGARIREHVTAVLEEPSAAIDLREPEFRYAMRARLFPEGGLPDFVGYARPVAPGLIEAICVDLPRSVRVLDDDAVASHDLDALFAMARSQLQFEPPADRTDLGHGVVALVGDSLFVASQVLNPRFVDAELAASPSGFAFLAPHRHQLLIAPILGTESVDAVNALAQIASSIEPQAAPGGIVSTALYFVSRSGIDCISDVDEATGEMRILAEGAFLAALDR